MTGPSGFAVVEVQIVRHKTMVGSYIRSKRRGKDNGAQKDQSRQEIE